jgi:hypothetical protein
MKRAHKVADRQGNAYETEGPIYQFPSLAECRETFAENLKYVIEWDDATDWTTMTLLESSGHFDDAF